VANTYSQIYVQVVFTVQGRLSLVPVDRKEELHKFMTGIVKNDGQKLISINSMPDHVHILIGLEPSIALSELVRDIKANSSRFINQRRWIKTKFAWQEGFGAFSYSRSQLDSVIHYIQNQEQHHRKRSFKDEYLELLRKFQVEFDAKHLFKFIEDE
jgi:putative transposase